MTFGRAKLGAGFFCATVFTLTAWAGEAAAYRLRLNGLELDVDEQTGDLVYLSYPATGVILRTSSDSAGLLDLAYPIESFVDLRLASRFSKARLVKNTNGLMIAWDQLGPSRSNFALPSGKVSAQVAIRAAGDGRSIILACRIENHSTASVPQVLFPDFQGLQPIDGPERTELRLARGVVQPFRGPVRSPELPATQDYDWMEYPAGSYYSENAMRWLDYGSLHGGLSIFQKKWGSDDRPNILTHRREADPMVLRLAWEHKATIAPGRTWESGEFWLTPHPGGWAKGIEVFREYVMSVSPPRELPPHVRDGLGFHSVMMSLDLEPDPTKVNFRYRDLPRLAQDALEHGINELHLYACFSYPDVSISARKELGGEQEFLEGVRQARALGVNVTGAMTIDIVSTPAAQRYGVKPDTEDWAFHYELIPNFRPYYARYSQGEAWVDSDNKLWQEDVLAALTAWINRGLISFWWDVFRPKPKAHGKPDLITLIEKVRSLARARDSESVFSGESVTPLSFEQDGQVLDYTLDSVTYVDAGPILNVLRAPRPNCAIYDSPLLAKKCFSDGLYLTAMPGKPDKGGGTALISEVPALSAALKEVAALRRQFLPFFVDGIFIGESVLSEPTYAFVRGHQLGDRLLIIVLNDRSEPQYVTIQSELGLWLRAGPYCVNSYDRRGQLAETTRVKGARWSAGTRLLQPAELAYFVIEAQGGPDNGARKQ